MPLCQPIQYVLPLLTRVAASSQFLAVTTFSKPFQLTHCDQTIFFFSHVVSNHVRLNEFVPCGVWILGFLAILDVTLGNHIYGDCRLI